MSKTAQLLISMAIAGILCSIGLVFMIKSHCNVVRIPIGSVGVVINTETNTHDKTWPPGTYYVQEGTNRDVIIVDLSPVVIKYEKENANGP